VVVSVEGDDGGNGGAAPHGVRICTKKGDENILLTPVSGWCNGTITTTTTPTPATTTISIITTIVTIIITIIIIVFVVIIIIIYYYY